MWNRNINIDILNKNLICEFEVINKLVEEKGVEHLFRTNNIKSIQLINKMFPNLSFEEKIKVIEIAYYMYNNKKNDEFDIVVTAPVSFNIKSRKTHTVIDELINESNKSILITGYSVSDYVDDKIEKIIDKVKSGVIVKLFVNDFYSKESQFKNLVMYKGKFLSIYNYKADSKDKMAALHAKVIVSDKQKGIVTSSNLSYHGILGNIEMGVVFNSNDKCIQIEKIFNELIKKKVFEKI